MDIVTFKALSLALGLGLQRERAGARLGGIRTFPLLALFGAVCGLLAQEWTYVIPAAGLIAVTVLVMLAHLDRSRAQDGSAGQTTEVSALLTYTLGVVLASGRYGIALVVGGVTAVLLYFKEPMHEFAGGLSEADLRAVMRFVIITLIILPILPNATYGPYSVLNPSEIWLMVVLIVGIGLTGYVSYKVFRSRTGTAINGILGGLISSTATTVAYARRVRGSATGVSSAAVIIAIAWTVSVTRVIVEVLVAAPTLTQAVVPPLAILLGVMIVGCGAMWAFGGRDAEQLPAQHNPAELQGALIFGLVYGVVIFATAAVRDRFGEHAVFAVAAVSGVVDVDAITLSTARLASAGTLDPSTAWRVIMLASLSNVLFKGGALLALGSGALFLRALPVFAGALLGGAVLMFGWPA